jgi:hypothetical protein
MQAGARGIPWLASAIPAFRRWKSGGILSETLDEWHLNLRHLVMEGDLRRRLGAQGRAAAEAREINQMGTLWLEALRRATQPSEIPVPSLSLEQ